MTDNVKRYAVLIDIENIPVAYAERIFSEIAVKGKITIKRGYGNFIEQKDNNNTQQNVKYFVVWVDLNGDRRPNTTAWSEKKPADVVPFIITTAGKVIPAGAPILDNRYSTVRIQYPVGSDLKYSRESMTFLQGQVKAYNNRQYPSYELFSIINSIFTDGTNGNILYTSDEFTNKRNTIIQDETVDSRCTVANGEPPQCTLLLDENIKY